MKLVTNAEMQAIDSSTIQNFHIPGIVLMENAGRSIADWIIKRYPSTTKIVILSGSGNNGGDGFVIARHLTQNHFSPSICLLSSPKKLKGDAAQNYKMIQSLQIPIEVCEDLDHFNKFHATFLADNVLLIDAIFGTGLSGEITGYKKNVIDTINSYDSTVVSVDVPSGLLCDGSTQGDSIINAAYTLTIGLPKVGMQDWPGASYCGSIEIIDIGFPDLLTKSEQLNQEWIDADWVIQNLPKRLPTSHKGNMGRVAIIGGAAQYPGAPRLSALGALFAGCGLVDLIIPASAGGTASYEYADIITHTVLDNGVGCFSDANSTQVTQIIDTADAIVLGPGIGRDPNTAPFIKTVLATPQKKVLDADALFFIAENKQWLQKSPAESVLTPHIGELSRLSAVPKEQLKYVKADAALQLNKEVQATVVVKDAATLISEYKGMLRWSRSGHPAMARGGMGDVLAGVIAAFIARGSVPADAAALAVYIHGLCGSMLAEKYGADGVTAVRLAKALPASIKLLHEDISQAKKYSKEPCCS